MIKVQVKEDTNEESGNLFGQWNTENNVNVTCAKHDCEACYIEKAYKVIKSQDTLSSDPTEFIIPLCMRCYKGSIKASSLEPGQIISVEEALLVAL